MAASLETNKILAALLTAGVIASGSGVISRILYSPTMPEENAYVIEVAAVATEGGEAPATVPLPVRLAEADPEQGAAAARKCATCHSFEAGGPVGIGPPLWDVVGRDIASVAGFAYSDALLGVEGAWTFEALDEFIGAPRGRAPGTKMAFAGIRDPAERADVLAYLRTLADEPVPLPEVETGAAEGEAGAAAGAAPEGAAAAAGSAEQTAALQEGEQGAAATGEAAAGDGIGALLAQADVDAGARHARKCGACHSFEEGGPNKIGPPLWDVVGRDIASIEGFAYSDALTGKDGTWDYEALDAFLAQPRDWASGTKMAFIGLKTPKERADIILYLRSLSSDPAPLP